MSNKLYVNVTYLPEYFSLFDTGRFVCCLLRYGVNINLVDVSAEERNSLS